MPANRKAGDETAPTLAGKRPIRPNPVVIDGVDQNRSWIGSAVFGRRGAGWRTRRSRSGTEGRGPATHARQWADDEVRADPSDCVEAIPDRRARHRTRGEDDARPDGDVSRRWRANRNPKLRQLLAPFPLRASRPQTPEPVRRCRFRPGTPLISSPARSCANASIASIVGRPKCSGTRADQGTRSCAPASDPRSTTVMRIDALLHGN